jgi:hypothetical protein
MGRHGDYGWDAVRSQPSYRVFIWVYRVWLALALGFTVAAVVTPTISALWVAASGAGAAVLVVILLAVSLRRAGVPVLWGLTDRELASVIIFEDLFG